MSPSTFITMYDKQFIVTIYLNNSLSDVRPLRLREVLDVLQQWFPERRRRL